METMRGLCSVDTDEYLIMPGPPEGNVSQILAQLTKVIQLQLDTQAQISALAAGQSSLLLTLEPKTFPVKEHSFTPAPPTAPPAANNTPAKPRVTARTVSFFAQEEDPDDTEEGKKTSKPFKEEELQFGEAHSFLSRRGMDSFAFQDEEEEAEDNREQPEFELNPAWQRETLNASRPAGRWTRKASADIFKTSSHTDMYGEQDFNKVALRGSGKNKIRFPTLSKMVISPASNLLAVWSLCEAALLFYDLVAIPASVLDPPHTVFDDVMKWISIFFWTVDMPAGCFKGFVTKHGDMEMRFSKVAKHYLKNHFLVDIILLVIEYVNFIMWVGDEESSQEMNFVDGRFIRMLRFTRLLKCSKFRRLFRRLVVQVSSLSMVTIIYTCGELMGIVLLCHAGACGWYAIGSQRKEALPLGEDGAEIDLAWVGYPTKSASFAYKYSTCLQWAISQLGYGGIDIFPTNVGERIYSVVFTLICMVALYLWLAALVSSLIRLQRSKEMETRETDMMRNFLRMHKVSYDVRNRIWKVLRANPEEESFVIESELGYFKDLPKPLALALRVEVFIPVLTRHPFFGTYGVSNADKHCMQRLIRGDAIQHARLQPEENLFLPGDSGRCMYFILTGGIDYYWNGSYKQMLPKDWLSEASLWLKWCHHGHASTQKRTELVTLRAEEFQSTMSALAEAQRYAKTYFSFALQNTNLLSDSFPEPEKISQMADDIFSPQTFFNLASCQPDQNEWDPSRQDWKFVWKSTWAPSHLLSSTAMIMTLTTEMKHDSVIVFQTLFSQNLPMKHPFNWSSMEEREAYDLRILFLKRYLLLLAVCKVQFSDEDNGTALNTWPFPLASTICHGGRVLLQLQNITWKEMLGYLLWGEEAATREVSLSNLPFPFYTRRAATHGVVMDKDTLSLRETRLSGTAALSSNHLGMDVPVGGLGNPTPVHIKQGELKVGPAGVPFKSKDYGEDGAKAPKAPQGPNAYVNQIQHGHLYARFDDFGSSIIRRLYPVKKSGGGFESFDMNEESLKEFMQTNPSLCFNGITLAHKDWDQVHVQNERDLAELLMHYNPQDTPPNEDRLKRLKRLLAEQELILEESRQGGDEVRCRGNLLHIVFHLSQERKVLVQTQATAVEERSADAEVILSHLAGARNRSAFAEVKDVRVPTVVCRHNELWTSVLSRYCKKTFGLSEAAVAHVVRSCEKHAKLHNISCPLSVCYHHVDACSDGFPMDYEVLQLTVHIDQQDKHLFEPLFSEGRDEFVTTEENIDVCGFAHLQASGSLTRTWQWMGQDEIGLIKVKGLHAPKGATKLDLLSESLNISSLLIGVENCAPLREDIFGKSHGVDAKSKELSAFGKRKWRDFRTGGQAVPADLGGMRVVVNRDNFSLMKKVCSSMGLCQPSDCFTQGNAPKDEMDSFKNLLQKSEHQFVAGTVA